MCPARDYGTSAESSSSTRASQAQTSSQHGNATSATAGAGARHESGIAGVVWGRLAGSTVVLGIWCAAESCTRDGPPGMGPAAGDISRLGSAGGSITVVIHARVRTVSDPSSKPVPGRIASLSKPPSSLASASALSPEPPDDFLSGPTGIPFGPMILLNNRPARSAFRTSASSDLWAQRICLAAWVTCFRRPGLMFPSTFRFATRLYFLGNASVPESIDIPNDLLLPENQWERTSLVRPALPKHSFPMSAIRVAETARHCPERVLS